MNPSDRSVALSLKLYRALANAFPHEFKNAYGHDLLHVTEDAVDSIWRRHGLWGLVRLLADIAVRVPAEYVSEFWQDIRYGIRMLAKSPGFTAVALISLGLGIGIGTAGFSQINASVLRDLPLVKNPDQLVSLQGALSYPTYERYAGRADLFSSTFAYVAPVPFGVTLAGRTERVWGHLITPEYFSTLGVNPALGRFFDERDLQRGQAPMVVISNRFWKNRLGSDPWIVGKALHINGHPSSVIGVGPKDFSGASPMMLGADVWMPVYVQSGVVPELGGNALERRDLPMFQMVGRLKPGIDMARAEAELDVVARQMEREFGDPDVDRKDRRVLMTPGGKVIPVRPEDLPMYLGFSSILLGLVLLIACSNVANMMLARAAGRRKEIAIRLAMGASRWRLIRQLLTESALLAMAAGVLALLLTQWLMSLISTMKLPYPVPMDYTPAPDGRVLLFTLALSLLTSLAFGLAPALQATRPDFTPALKEGAGMRLGRYRRLSLRNLLMVYQVAGSLMLLLLTGFLVRGFGKTVGFEVGFNAKHLYMISLDPVRDGYSPAQATDFFDKLTDRVQAMPAVKSASLTQTVPFGMTGNGSVTFSRAGSGPREIGRARKYIVGRDFFETLGIPVLSGRGFRKGDETSDGISVLVNETLAKEFWDGDDPVGRHIEIAGNQLFAFDGLKNARAYDNLAAPISKAQSIVEVAGVVKDVKMEFVFDQVRPAMYLPLRRAEYAHPPLEGVALMVRAAPGVDALSAVRRTVAMMDADLGRDLDLRNHRAVRVGAGVSGPGGSHRLLRGAAWTGNRNPYGAGRAACRCSAPGDEGRRSSGGGGHCPRFDRSVGGCAPDEHHTRIYRQGGECKHHGCRVAGRSTAAAGRPGAGGLLRAGSQVDEHRSGLGFAPGVIQSTFPQAHRRQGMTSCSI
jgi:putative ABC transport system permease protein